MTVKIYVPRDAAAIALGAEKVAAALSREIAARGIDATIVRNGSRGMFWLEPLVEVETAGGRVGYGPVKAGDVAALLDAGLYGGRCPCTLSWKGRGPSLPERADPADLRALRRHRSAVACRLQGAWRPQGARESRGDGRLATSSGK